MKDIKAALRLYAITNDLHSPKDIPALLYKAEQAILGGITMLQLRQKSKILNEEQLSHLAISLKALCDKHDLPFIINDNVDLAKKLCCGVHLGPSDMEVKKARDILGKDAIIGASARTVEAALGKEAQGANYLGCGAVFATSTKKDAHLLSQEVLHKICQKVSIGVVAIGGISKDNIMQLQHSGVSGVALVSGIFLISDTLTSTQDLLKKSLLL